LAEPNVPRDREGTFEPQIVRKRQRRLDGLDQIVLSLTARGLTTGEVAAHFAGVYGASVSKDMISRITEKMTAEMFEGQHRPEGGPTDGKGGEQAGPRTCVFLSGAVQLRGG
jgi:putative transposase